MPLNEIASRLPSRLSGPLNGVTAIRPRNTGLEEKLGPQIPNGDTSAPGKIFDFTAPGFQIGEGRRRILCRLACSMLRVLAWI
jgi:hypothetical protein